MGNIPVYVIVLVAAALTWKTLATEELLNRAFLKKHFPQEWELLQARGTYQRPVLLTAYFLKGEKKMFLAQYKREDFNAYGLGNESNQKREGLSSWAWMVEVRFASHPNKPIYFLRSYWWDLVPDEGSPWLILQDKAGKSFTKKDWTSNNPNRIEHILTFIERQNSVGDELITQIREALFMEIENSPGEDGLRHLHAWFTEYIRSHPNHTHNVPDYSVLARTETGQAA